MGFFSTLFGEGIMGHIVGFNSNLYIYGSIICALLAYLLGSINFAIIISRKQFNEDIRKYGSGNAGMTNMMRTYGKSAAALTLLGDALKAVVATLIGYLVLGQFGAYLAGFFCIIGHMFPIFYNFKGGKGVVTASASILMCNPYVFLVLLILFVTIVAIWRFISLASIMCVLLYPVILNGIETLLNGYCGIYIIFAVLTTVFVVAKHKDNIKRLLEGKESKFYFKKDVKTKDKNN